MTIHANIAAFNAAVAAVAEHPMCFRLVHEGASVVILYPFGDFPVHGVRTVRSAAGLRAALDVMERHWVESFPTACGVSSCYGGKPC